MNSPAALQWLHADFEQGLQRYKRKLRHGASTGNGMARS